ncbi:hypothetical protein BWI96_07425 [Siphonobacter sp. SORGH_AS_0500]|nr:hypothetical protein BWI96_07425 [Siphonobacter sp. SORGH_AS_0500]
MDPDEIRGHCGRDIEIQIKVETRLYRVLLGNGSIWNVAFIASYPRRDKVASLLKEDVTLKRSSFNY